MELEHRLRITLALYQQEALLSFHDYKQHLHKIDIEQQALFSFQILDAS